MRYSDAARTHAGAVRLPEMGEPSTDHALRPSSETIRPLVLCPLVFERRCLERAGLASWSDLLVCGCGAAAVSRFVSKLDPGSRPVILAGLAGGLDRDLHAGSAVVVEHVVDGTGGAWRAPLTAFSPDEHARKGGVATSTPQALVDEDGKNRIAVQTGAAIVDLESVAFARIASERRWRWGIVRGVSDGIRDRLPDDVGRWVDVRGRTRPLRVAAGLVRRPSDLILAIRLQRSGATAMRVVASALAGLRDLPVSASGTTPISNDVQTKTIGST